MRRDYFTPAIDGVDGTESQQPTLTVSYEGPAEQLEDRLYGADGPLEGDDIDVAYRLRDPLEADGAGGVVAFTNRITGEYILEFNLPAEDVLAFVDAARDYGKTTDGAERYRAVVETDDGVAATLEKAVLLVYGPDGELLRGHSLIPSGVEL